VFKRTEGVWARQEKLSASDGTTDDGFGYSVAASGDTVIVGALLDDELGTDSGAAWAYELLAP